MTRVRVLLVAVAVLGAACTSGSGDKRAGRATTTTTTAPAITTSTAAPSNCPAGIRTPEELGTPQNLADLQMVGPQKGFAVGKGVILGTDDGHIWTPRYTGAATFVSVDAVDSLHAWAAGDRALYATVDGGKNWVGVGSPDDGTVLRRVHFIDEHVGWGVGRGKLYRSGDGGHTWAELSPPCGAEAVCFTTHDDGWVAVGNRIARSTTGGDSWTSVYAVPNQTGDNGWYPEALQCAKGGVAWALFVGDNGAMGHLPYAIYRGTAAGEWTLVAKEGMTAPQLPEAPSLGGYPAPISVIGSDVAMLLTYTGPIDVPVGLRLATERGRRFGTMHNIPNLATPRAASFVSATTGWVLGPKPNRTTGTPTPPSPDLILGTADGGQTWEEQFVRPQPTG